ncbi:hypothetical protein PG984_015060 [Apiospora sp. TS-2023a]
MDIQHPPSRNMSEWPFKSSSSIRRLAHFKTTAGRQFIDSKLWNCATLARNVRDCAFVGLDIEGRDNSPAQLGLAYLAEMPTTEPTLLTGPLRSLKEKIGCQLRCINIKGGEQDDVRRGRKKHLPCQFANKNTEADAFERQEIIGAGGLLRGYGASGLTIPMASGNPTPGWVVGRERPSSGKNNDSDDGKGRERQFYVPSPLLAGPGDPGRVLEESQRRSRRPDVTGAATGDLGLLTPETHAAIRSRPPRQAKA